MKIEFETKDVRVERFGTIADALYACYGKHPFANHRMWHKDPDPERTKVLQAPLQWEHEGPYAYSRTLALVTFDQETKAPEFYRALAERGYYPASLSESLSFLKLLSERGVKADSVFHLGTVLRSPEHRESRLLTRRNGDFEFVPYYPRTTRIKAGYRIVVVKKEPVPKRQ